MTCRKFGMTCRKTELGVKMKRIIYILLTIVLAASCGGDAIKVVVPTNELGDMKERTENMQLTPGKLIRINAFTPGNCARAVAEGLCLDVMLSDFIVFAEGVTEDDVVDMFVSAKAAMDSTGAKMWCVHLPYSTYNVAELDEVKRLEGVGKLTWLMNLSMEYFKPQCFVIHPSSGRHITGTEKFTEGQKQSRRTIAALQAALDADNEKYGMSSILCVENCARSVGYDAASLLELLDAEGLEKVRICLDTGHSLIPLNGRYRNYCDSLPEAAENGDAVKDLKLIGTRLGTLHIQQNHGAVGREGSVDIHLEPFDDGLIDWGEFYDVLLNECRYRGCFLYETSNIEVKGDGLSTMESVHSNYYDFIYPAYIEYLKK